MPFNLVIFLLIHLVVLVFMIETLRRLYNLSTQYPLEEDRHALPLGFVRLKHVVILYLVVYVFWILVSIWLYRYFVDPSFIFGSGARPSTSTLNL